MSSTTSSGIIAEKAPGSRIEANLSRRLEAVYGGMVELVELFRADREKHGVELFDFFVERDKKPEGAGFDSSVRYVLEWYRTPLLRKLSEGRIGSARRIHPFSPSHPTCEVVHQVVNTHCPSFLPVLAAYDDIRVTLNASYASTLFKLRAVRSNAENASSFDIDSEAASKLSRAIVRRTPSLSSVLQNSA